MNNGLVIQSKEVLRVLLYIILMAISTWANVASAQTTSNGFPNRPIRIVVGFAPGGGSDFISRIIAQKLTQKLGQPVIVENRPGAGGNLAAEHVVKSENDGHTLLVISNSYAVNANIYRLPFDPIQDITPIAKLADGPFIVAVNPKIRISKLKDLVDFAKNNPGKLTFASAGNGSVTHIATEYFINTSNIEMLHIPYKGTSPALTDIISGQVQVMFGSVASTAPHVKSGKLQALAVTTKQRLSTLPDVPTVMESGYPSYEVTVWHGIIGPKNIAPSTVAILNSAVNEALRDSSLEKQFSSEGLSSTQTSAQQFGGLITEEIQKWGQLVRVRNISSQ